MALIDPGLLRPRKAVELGKIKIGGLGEERKKRTGTGTYQLPTKYDHFRVVKLDRDETGNLRLDEEVHAHPDVGDNPTRLKGRLMFETVEENFHSEMVQYKGRGRDGKIWSCDGVEYLDIKNNLTGPCKLANGSTCDCKPYSRLQLNLDASGMTLGFHVFRSQGWGSAGNIQSVLQDIYRHFGTCMGAPVELRCYPSVDTYTDANGNEKTSTSTKVALVLAMSVPQAALLMAEQKKALASVRQDYKLIAGEVQDALHLRDSEEWEDTPDYEVLSRREGPPSEAQVVDTSAGDAEAGDPAKAEPLPSVGKEKKTMRAKTQADLPTEEPAGVPEETRRRFFATLRAYGVADAQRKTWVVEQGLPESTKEWTQADFDRVQEIMVGPTRDAVLANAEELGLDLGKVSQELLGKPSPLYLEDWQKVDSHISTLLVGEEDDL